MSRPAISVENLSKAYRIGLEEQRHDTLVGSILAAARYPLKNFHHLRRLNTFRHQEECEDIFWALRDVSFDVTQGEVIGIIGRNGAGKSTLLKVLSRITEPTSGRAIIRGRVSSLLEVGTGFHQELTGRENVYMNGTILGMTKREIDRKFDQIVDFSGVEKFLDTPIKHYSSGMKVRLAFSVAAHLEPEILIIDEVLAVGDAEFQKKCLGKMQDVAIGGRTVLFVSHNMAAVQNLCSNAIVLAAGSIADSGPVAEVIDTYLRIKTNSESGDFNRRSRSVPMVQSISLVSNGKEVTSISTGDPLDIRVKFHSPTPLSKPALGVAWLTRTGERVGCVNNKFMQSPTVDGLRVKGEIGCRIPELLLLPGEYTLDIYFGDRYGDYDIIEEACELVVHACDFYGTGKLPPRGYGSWAIRANWTYFDE